MKFKNFLSEHENVKTENKLLKFVIIVLAITVMFNFYYVDKASHSEKIIILPPQLHSKVVFNGNKPDKAYFDQITRYVISLALDYTSATARGQFAELLTMLSPSAFKVYQPALYDLANRLESAGDISNAFYISTIKVKKDKNQIIVEGMNDTYSANTLLKQQSEQYQIGYEVKSDRFIITSFNKVKANGG